MIGSRKTILVTGVTGNVGRPVVEQLLRLGAEVKAGVRDPGRVAGRLDDGVEPVRLDFTDPTTYSGALEGANGLFLLRPPSISKVKATLNVLVDEAVSMGVEHVVFLSVAGADRAGFIPHAKVEAHLRRSDVAWTFLRAGFFAQNLGDAYQRDIVSKDSIVLPAGRGRASFVDVRDVARVGAQALVDGSLKGEAPELAGPEALGFEDAARMLSDALGREIRYLPVGIPRYLAHLRRAGDPWGQVIVKTALHVGLRFGQGEIGSDRLAELLGRSPTALRTYIEDHLDLWKR